MAGHFTLHLHTKPFIKQYLLSLYGDPLIFASDNCFGMVLASCLEKNIRIDRAWKEIVDKFDRLSVSLEVQLPRHWLANYYNGIGLTYPKILFINKLFEERFEEDLWRYCKAETLRGITRKRAIENFCEEHKLEIPEHITFDNLKQTEYRYRQKKAALFPLDLSRPAKQYSQKIS